MKTKAVADMIYKIFKENNTDFKEFYILTNEEYGIPKDCGDFYLLIVINNNIDKATVKHNVYDLLEPLCDDFEIYINVKIEDEERFKTSPSRIEFTLGVHRVA